MREAQENLISIFGLLLLLATETLMAQGLRVPAMSHLKNTETFGAGQLALAERQEIERQLEAGSFDVPDSWDREVRVRRVPLGAVDGLVVQGTALLCGGTGNCQTWVFRRVNGHWIDLFTGQAPVVSTFGFDEPRSHGIKGLVVAANASAETGEYTLYEFDGKFYRNTACYQSFNSGTKETVKKIACR